uniref:Odorranain-H-RA1 antimocrobial peptide n=1 Tax=Odorrana andersonii TaxID=369514 RepID=D2K8B8_ODOAN|nr:odorranain-H-RA1 antimocrobial peptide precursor [Odorrana andersonii]ADP06065.1 odorranain-H-RA1 peptide precursor [Odorrana andersonii]ADP06066.1 odorranain-H-RA1 peptide precursor [Odorrana andersonii]ADP06067.1 odorranain-H-RA1 peptide precursor [Odorrana andersonii]ADP06081.1 odorranain-H-RA1 peptide precursor [Odorrana andersonii]
MFTMKKPLLLLFFLGTINLSLCQDETNAEEERRDEEVAKMEEIKRGIFGKILGVGKKVLCGLSGMC